MLRYVGPVQSVARGTRGDDAGPRLGAPPGAPVAVAVGAALVAGAAMVLPWTRSGAVARNAFATVGSAVRLGVLPDGPLGVVVLVWFAVPFLALAALLASATGRARIAAGLAGLTGLAAGSLAVAVLRGPLATGAGAVVGLVASAVAVAAAVVAGRPAR